MLRDDDGSCSSKHFNGTRLRKDRIPLINVISRSPGERVSTCAVGLSPHPTPSEISSGVGGTHRTVQGGGEGDLSIWLVLLKQSEEHDNIEFLPC